MNYSMVTQIGQTLEDGAHDLVNLVKVEGESLLILIKVQAVDVLHDKVDVPLIFYDFNQLYQGWMP